jgi:hypothetical protein
MATEPTKSLGERLYELTEKLLPHLKPEQMHWTKSNSRSVEVEVMKTEEGGCSFLVDFSYHDSFEIDLEVLLRLVTSEAPKEVEEACTILAELDKRFSRAPRKKAKKAPLRS